MIESWPMFCNWTLGTGLYWKLSDGKEDLISLSSLPSGQFLSASLDFNAKVQNKIKFYFEQFSCQTFCKVFHCTFNCYIAIRSSILIRKNILWKLWIYSNMYVFCNFHPFYPESTKKSNLCLMSDTVISWQTQPYLLDQ